MPLPFMRMMGVAGLPDPDRLDRRGRDAPAGAALALRPSRRRAQADPARRAARSRAGASGRGSRGRSWRGRSCSSLLGGTVLARGGAARVRAPAHARLDLRHPAHAAVGARLRRAREGCRARRRRAVDRARDRDGRARCSSRRSRRRSAGSPPALRRDPEVAAVAAPPAGRYVDPTRHYRQVLIAGAPRLRLPRGAGVRAPAARRADPGGRRSRRASR